MQYRRSQDFTLNSIWFIIIINLAVYFATTVSAAIFHNEAYFYFLSLVPANVLKYPWTLFTAMFVHASFWHIFGNMLTLYFFGTFLYRLVGRNKFLLVYFGGGLVGNIVYVLLNLSSYIPVVGASGAIFAVAGTLAMLAPNVKVMIYFLIPMRLWVAVLVFFGLWSIPNFIPDVAWQAHLGGIVAGLAAGYFFKKNSRYYIPY